jgi:hypothetical protein
MSRFSSITENALRTLLQMSKKGSSGVKPLLSVPNEAKNIPKIIYLPKGFKALRRLDPSKGSGEQLETLHFSVVDPRTKLGVGVIEFQWDNRNRMYRPMNAPGVNIYPEAQGKGLYPAFIKELNKFVDVGSAATTTAGTTENAQKVWKKLGASIESVSGDPDIPQAFVLRRGNK